MSEIQLAGEDAYMEDVWDKLPLDRIAFLRENLDAVEGEHLNEIGRIFARNKVQDRLGVYVNHRHFELQPGERLVEYGMVQTPWQLQNSAPAVKDRVATKTWAFAGGELTPTEFKFVAGEERMEPMRVPTDFVDELRTYLDTNNLTGLLGLSTLPDDDMNPEMMFEMTVGRVSMIVPRDQFPEKEVTNVAWFFDENGAKMGKFCLGCSKH